jgi:hypothetical protein
MKPIVFFLMAGLLVLCVYATSGCTSSPPTNFGQTSSMTEADTIRIVETNHIPAGFKVVKVMGKGWYLIGGEVDGKQRKYLYRYNWSGNATTETMVEVKD